MQQSDVMYIHNIFKKGVKEMDKPVASVGIIREMVVALVSGGFCHGVNGDKSYEFVQSQIVGWSMAASKPFTPKVLAILSSNISNLTQYCGWTAVRCVHLARAFNGSKGLAVVKFKEFSGFQLISIEELYKNHLPKPRSKRYGTVEVVHAV